MVLYTIGKLCKEFNLSRSTLLYYDNIGLLKASERSEADYRRYSEEDKSRLSQICAFREAGVPLERIKEILNNEGASEGYILERRLLELNQEIRFLRLQQKFIVEMLRSKNLSDRSIPMDKETFTSILKSMGLDEVTLINLHKQFEEKSPESHQFFLEFLGISDDEIKHIREYSREDK